MEQAPLEYRGPFAMSDAAYGSCLLRTIDLDDNPQGLLLKAAKKVPLRADSPRNKLGSELEATHPSHCLLAAWHFGHTLPVGARAGIGTAGSFPVDGRRRWAVGARFAAACIPRQPGLGVSDERGPGGPRVSVEPSGYESATGHTAAV
jgi:hypothetical protein